jgi:outer membrane protein OmpA-like peptidoglycan-associated protein
MAGSAAPVSTVPAPTTTIPADPVLALPTVAEGPTTTELPADVLFEPNSATLLPAAITLLGGAAADLPTGARVDLVGRTATFGTAESSRAFSLERALACRDALVAAGVPVDRITVAGLGFDQPLVPDVDAAGRLIPDAAARNRTVSMIITAGGTP